jgi:integrase
MQQPQIDLNNVNPALLAQLAQLVAAQMQPAAAEDPKPKKERRAPKKQIKYFTEAEIESFFKSIDSTRDFAMFMVAYKRGLRASEIGALQLADYDVKAERLTFNRKKGSNGGLYHLTAKEVRALRAWLRDRGAEPGPLFPSNRGKGLSQQMQWKLMQRYGKRAGLDLGKCHPHTLKHSCATHLLSSKKESLESVRDHLGHRSIKSTEIYAQFTSGAREARDKRLRDW